MKLEVWPLDRLAPNKDNPRLITEADIGVLAKSIQAQGFLDPIEARAEDGLIVAGHRRYLAARALELVRVPVVVHEGMTNDEAKAYSISNNRLSEGVDWNRALLSDQLAGLPEEFSPDVLGFTDRDIASLFDLDRGLGPDGEDLADQQEAEASLLIPGEAWIIGPVTFNVFKGLDNQALSQAEKLIRKIAKMLKTKALLDGDESKPLDVVLKERGM